MNAAQYILVFGIRAYRWGISPAKTLLFGPLSQCRFTPSCSAYALEAVARHGALAGSWLALKRICRCHPWGGCGHDPVPPISHGLESMSASKRVCSEKGINVRLVELVPSGLTQIAQNSNGTPPSRPAQSAAD